MNKNENKFTELPEQEYNEQLNSLNSDINNLVSSLIIEKNFDFTFGAQALFKSSCKSVNLG